MGSSSVAVEGDVVTVCLSVVRGTVTTPTDITLTNMPVIGIPDEGGEPGPQPLSVITPPARSE